MSEFTGQDDAWQAGYLTALKDMLCECYMMEEKNEKSIEILIAKIKQRSMQLDKQESPK